MPARRTPSTPRKGRASGADTSKLRAVPVKGRARKIDASASPAGDDAVRAGTGKTWKQWFLVLDRAGAAEWKHPQIARFLLDQRGCTPWWSQMVTVGYERARGRRAVHQSAEGFSANKSMTFEVAVTQLFEAWVDAKQRARWLDEDIEIRTATRPKSLRMVWSDGSSRVNVGFTAKGVRRSAAALEHNRLTDRAAVERAKRYWDARLSKLKALLEK